VIVSLHEKIKYIGDKAKGIGKGNGVSLLFLAFGDGGLHIATPKAHFFSP
jgi:hypothetical protein